MTKKGPYALLGVLLLIIVFLGGIHYGKNVEKTNKTIDIISKLQKITPTSYIATQQTSYYKYTFPDCGIQFEYQQQENATKIATREVQFMKGGKETLHVTCSTTPSPTPASSEAKMLIHTYNGKEIGIPAKDSGDLWTFTLKHPSKIMYITITLQKHMYTLFEDTVKFLP